MSCDSVNASCDSVTASCDSVIMGSSDSLSVCRGVILTHSTQLPVFPLFLFPTLVLSFAAFLMILDSAGSF